MRLIQRGKRLFTTRPARRTVQSFRAIAAASALASSRRVPYVLVSLLWFAGFATALSAQTNFVGRYEGVAQVFDLQDVPPRPLDRDLRIDISQLGTLLSIDYKLNPIFSTLVFHFEVQANGNSFQGDAWAQVGPNPFAEGRRIEATLNGNLLTGRFFDNGIFRNGDPIPNGFMSDELTTFALLRDPPPPPTPQPQTFGVFIGSDDPLPNGTFKVRGQKDAPETRDAFHRLIPSMTSSFLGYAGNDFPVGGIPVQIFGELEQYTDQVEAGDNFVFFYHGHGRGNSADPLAHETLAVQLDQPDELFDPDREIVDEDLADWFNDPIRKSKWDDVNKLFILDTCFAGGFWAGADGLGLSALPNVALLAASKESEAGSLNVVESVAPGHSGEGYFTAALQDALIVVNGFPQADVGRDGLTVQDLSDFLASRYPATLFPNGLEGYINGPIFPDEPVTAPFSVELFQSPGFVFNFGTPVPEPSGLLSLGIATGLLMRRRRC